MRHEAIDQFFLLSRYLVSSTPLLSAGISLAVHLGSHSITASKFDFAVREPEVTWYLVESYSLYADPNFRLSIFGHCFKFNQLFLVLGTIIVEAFIPIRSPVN